MVSERKKSRKVRNVVVNEFPAIKKHVFSLKNELQLQLLMKGNSMDLVANRIKKKTLQKGKLNKTKYNEIKNTINFKT